MNLSSREKVLIVTLSVFAVIVVVGGIWLLVAKNKSNADAPALPSTENTSTEVTSNEKKESTLTSTTSTSDKPVLTLQPGFNLVGVPYILSPNDGKTVLLGLSTKEAYYLNSSGKWISLYNSGTIGPGDGYWIRSEKGEAYTLGVNQATEVDSAKPFSITLKKGWNAIANPFNKDITWNPSVKTTKGTTSFKKAVSAKIISVGYVSDPISKAYKILNAGDTLDALSGLLIKSGGDVELTVSGVK